MIQTPDSTRVILRQTTPELPTDADQAYQQQALIQVSRTFALTIPQLPPPLCDTVANAYLLCRIADTIEDAPNLSPECKRVHAERFIKIVEGSESPQRFISELTAALDEQTPASERELILQTERVLRLTHSYSCRVQQALARCVRIMSQGMAEFAEKASASGLPDLPTLDRYCYVVAGVVGEMLTELFCDYSPLIAQQEQALRRLAVSFGQGLQMTNILKDVWDDHQRQISWLPRSLFAENSCQLEQFYMQSPELQSENLRKTQLQLIAIAHGHLCDALDYTLLLPRQETGLRRFCLLAIGMAVLTLQKLRRNLDYRSGSQVKISRRAVKATMATSYALRFFAGGQDPLARRLFALAAKGLPCQRRMHEAPE